MTAIEIEQLYRMLHLAVEGLARAYDLSDVRVLHVVGLAWEIERALSHAVKTGFEPVRAVAH